MRLLRALVKGPRSWARPRDLHQLHHWFGFPWEFDKFEDILAVAQLRVLAHAGPGTHAASPLGGRSEMVSLAQQQCHRELFWRNQETLAAQGTAIKALEADLAGGMPLSLTKAQN